jgi:uncharacterized protein YecT (DUF1311 family)
MPSDRTAEPWPQTTYRGFSGPAQPPAAPRRRWPLILGAGAAAAIVLGVGAGLLVRPDIDNTEAAAARGPGVPIEVAKPPPPEPLRSAGKLEVLSPEQAAAARAQAPRVQAVEPPPSPAPEAAYTPPAPPPLPRVSGGAPLAATPPRMQPQPPQGLAERDPCATGSPAEQMVCADPRLAEADRELNRAYRRALAAGVSPGFLRSEQRDWLGIREEAARRSPRAVANIYAQRIDELNAMADDARRDRGYDDDRPDDGLGGY